ncbi:MAG: M48 family metalloprotease [Bdellovibrionota bacterium]|nr:M48 family metalloprotease [Bdellovibrionota bacterium]
MRDPVLNQLDSNLRQLTSSQAGRRAFIQSLPLLLAACATGNADRYREGSNEGQEISLSPADERKLTQEVLPKMKQDYPAIPNQKLQNYMSNLGNRIVASNGLGGNPYRYSFTVVDVPYVNAFALPAGTVFVTAPLIEMADSEAELAGVVGHEVGHIVARHSAERMELAKREEDKSIWYTLLGGLVGGAAGYGLGKLMCKPKDNECLQNAAKLGAIAGTTGGLLIQKYAFMANSREDEMEADRVGFKTSNRAGYHKDHVGRFYNKLYAMEQKAKSSSNKILASLTDAMSTHPPSKERVIQMQQMSSTANNSKGSVVSTREFKEAKAIASKYAERARQKAKA